MCRKKTVIISLLRNGAIPALPPKTNDFDRFRTANRCRTASRPDPPKWSDGFFGTFASQGTVFRRPVSESARLTEVISFQERLSDLIGPYWGTYGIGYRVLQPLLVGGP